MDLYDEDLEKIFIIDHEQLQFDRNSGWTFIIIPEKLMVICLVVRRFCIHDYIFDRIQSTRQDKNIMLKFLSNEQNENQSPCEAIDVCDDKIQKKKRTIRKKSPKHTLKRKIQKVSFEYRKKSFDEFRLMVVDPPSKLDDYESNILSGSLGIPSENKSNEFISNMLLTNILNHWDESKTQSCPSSIAMTLLEHISLKLCSIILK